MCAETPLKLTGAGWGSQGRSFHSAQPEEVMRIADDIFSASVGTVARSDDRAEEAGRATRREAGLAGALRRADGLVV